MSTVYLGLGSNLGDRQTFIQKALTLIAERAGTILSLSDCYETAPDGFDSPEKFLNMATAITTELPPPALLTVTQEIEQTIGRRDKTINGKYRDRIIDIDILMYDDLIRETPTLTIPHPLMHQRLFVLQPLNDIAPHAIHPVLRKTIAELYHPYLSAFEK